MEEPTMLATLAENWAQILVLFLIFLKGVLNLIPSQQPTVLFSFIDWVIDYLVPNRLSKSKAKKPKA
jgi:hypothetical protein